MPFGKKSGPYCPLDGFRQLEKLFIHAFHLFSGLIHPGGVWDRVAFRGAARQGVRLRSCGIVTIFRVIVPRAALSLEKLFKNRAANAVNGFTPFARKKF